MARKWTDKMNCDFITKYVELESLWNRNHRFYSNTVVRNAAHKELCDVVNIPGFTVNDVRRKISNMRSTYTLERHRVKRSSSYRPTLVWFHIMDAKLRNHIIERKPTQQNTFHYTRANITKERDLVKRRWPSFEYESFDTDETVTTLGKFGEDTMARNCHHEPVNVGQQLPILPQPAGWLSTAACTSSKSSYSGATRGVSCVSHRRHSAEPFNKRQEIGANENTTPTCMDDEFDLFGKSIALQLRKMPLKVALDTHIQIQTIIMNARLTPNPDGS